MFLTVLLDVLFLNVYHKSLSKPENMSPFLSTTNCDSLNVVLHQPPKLRLALPYLFL